MKYGIGRRPTAALAALLMICSAGSGSQAAVLQNAGHVAHRLQSVHDSKTDCGGQQTSPPSNLCLTKGCVTAAHHLLSAMDTSVDPCDDFYSFACGSFVKNTVIPDDASRVSHSILIQDELHLDMRKLIDAPIEPEDSPATVMLKKYFTSCMDTAGIENKGLEPMKEILKTLGNWPVLQGAQWNEGAFDWAESIYRSRELGLPIDHLFTVTVIPDVINDTRHHLLYLAKASLNQRGQRGRLAREDIAKGFNDSKVQSYYNYMVDMAVLMGAEPEQAKYDMEGALRFEIELVNMTLLVEQPRNISELDIPLTLDELSLVVPAVPWVTYVNRLLQPAGHTVSGNETVVVTHVDYFKSLGALLETTSKRVLANYLLWRAVEASVSVLNKDARDVRLKYESQTRGTTEHQPRWEECLELANAKKTFLIAAGSLYVKNHFDEQSKKAALELVADVHQQFNIMLQEVDWMNDAIKRKAIELSEAIEYNVGYPDELLNDTLVAEYYEGLDISDDDYFQNQLNTRLFFNNMSVKNLREPVKRKDWTRLSGIAVVNAYYDPVTTRIEFPAGILRGVFYSSDRPNYLNYGAIGNVIGHEISHGLASMFPQLDSEGKLQDWWDLESVNKLGERVQCFIEQYNNITVQSVNMSVNGFTTRGENMADAGGMKMARRAYQLHQQKAGREPALPGLQHYSSEQMFWLGAASFYCDMMRPERLRQILLSNKHLPGSVRVNTSLRNTRQFAEDWQCAPGSRMNPAERCGVW